jgi:DNA-binding response OmpR family regulator
VNETRSRTKVLIVDDDVNVTGFLTRLLVSEGYAVEVAQDGAGGLPK